MDRNNRFFAVLICVQFLQIGDLATGNLRLKPAVKTVDTDGYQLTNNAYVGAWLLRIMNGTQFACGAAYYNPLHVITSASCMHKYKSGMDNLSVEFLAGHSFALIDKLLVSRQYEWPSNYMDIAVIKLVNPIPGQNNDFVKLCSKPLEKYKKLTVVACSASHKNLRTQQVSLMNHMECERQYRTLQLTETVACTHAFDQANECIYNFGCPITAGDELCGVVEFGPECRNENLPGLFTDIYQVKHFIRKVVYGKLKPQPKITKQTWFDK